MISFTEEFVSRVFAEIFPLYMACTPELQKVIRDMIEIVGNPDCTKQESAAALLTIAEALFPHTTDKTEKPKSCPHSTQDHYLHGM